MATVARLARARRRRRRGARGGRARLGVRAAEARGCARRAIARGFPLAVAALNRAGHRARARRHLAGELRRAGLRAMGEVAARLGLGDAHVVFGHTHRAGPLAGDEPSEWTAVARRARGSSTRGCWTYASIFLDRARAGESPYWPGNVRARRGRGPAAARAAAARSLARGAAPSCRAPPASQRRSRSGEARREAGRHGTRTPGADLELEHAGGVARVLEQRIGARLRDRQLAARCRSRPSLARTVPAPSSTAHTPPAS